MWQVAIAPEASACCDCPAMVAASKPCTLVVSFEGGHLVDMGAKQKACVVEMPPWIRPLYALVVAMLLQAVTPARMLPWGLAAYFSTVLCPLFMLDRHLVAADSDSQPQALTLPLHMICLLWLPRANAGRPAHAVTLQWPGSWQGV